MSQPIPEEKISELSELLFRGRKIEAIKLYRELTGLGLKESKEGVEELEVLLRKQTPEKFSAPPAKGCFGAAAVFCLCAGAVVCWVAFA